MKKQELREYLRDAPEGPGVYIFRDKKGRYLYVGKARDIAQRLSSYLNTADPRARAMLRRARSLEWLRTGSEAEALFTEASLVRFQKPPFNIRLAGGEYYPYIKITVAETWPRIFVTRKLVDDGSLYFGPYPDAAAARRAVVAIRSIFPIRPCRYRLPSKRVSLCIYYYMGRCPGPCELEVDRELYASYVRGAADVLSGKSQDLEKLLEREMEKAARDLRFEVAASLRDSLWALRKTLAAPAGFGEGGESRDIVVIAPAEGMASVVLVALRQGRPGIEERFLLEAPRGARAGEMASAFIKDYYTSRPPGVKRIVSVPLPEDTELLEEALSQRAGTRVRITAPGKQDRRFVEIARLAAEEHLARAGENLRARVHPGLRELEEILGLETIRHIEAFDISHTAGRESVASSVAFVNGRPHKSLYRRYRIRGARGGDDYAAIQEAVFRRLKALAEQGGPLPDLLLIDGGPGQLAAAMKAAESLGLLDKMGFAALAKRYEELFLPGGGHIVLPGRSRALLLLKRIRDESHRFAVKYHRLLRGKRGAESLLDSLPGVGPARKRALLRYFGSLERLKGASPEEIARVPGIGKRTAERIWEFLRG